MQWVVLRYGQNLQEFLFFKFIFLLTAVIILFIILTDFSIDLGPEGGDKLGGNIVFSGKTEDILKENKSYTAKYLKKIFENK